MVAQCAYEMVAAEFHVDPHPAEYCTNEPEPGSEYCWIHIEGAETW